MALLWVPGISKTITAPVQSMIYYALWKTPGCSNSTCVSISIIVYTSPVVPSAISASNYNICSADSGNITLSQSGGTGNYFSWYRGYCGGILVGTGKNLIIDSTHQ